MQPISSMLRRTTHQVSRQSDLFALRARKATGIPAGETRTASRDFASAVRAEAGAWTKYVRETAAATTGALAPRAIERTVLVRASLTLRAIDATIRQRLDALDGSKRRAKAKHANGCREAPRQASRSRRARESSAWVNRRGLRPSRARGRAWRPASMPSASPASRAAPRRRGLEQEAAGGDLSVSWALRIASIASAACCASRAALDDLVSALRDELVIGACVRTEVEVPSWQVPSEPV